jgi:hypothetical protein
LLALSSGQLVPVQDLPNDFRRNSNIEEKKFESAVVVFALVNNLLPESFLQHLQTMGFTILKHKNSKNDQELNIL